MAIKDLNELLPEFKDKVELLIMNFRNQNFDPNIDIAITETYRPQSRQNELYAQGRTKLGNKVTWTKHSKHTLRKAVDFAIIYKYKLNWDLTNIFVKAGYERIGELAKQLGLIWGGDFKTPDMPHVEMK